MASFKAHILVTFGQICNFCDPNLASLFLFLRIDSSLDLMNNTFHLQYEHSGTFANSNRKYEELSYPEKSENVC